jgi:hypothetical protein
MEARRLRLNRAKVSLCRLECHNRGARGKLLPRHGSAFKRFRHGVVIYVGVGPSISVGRPSGLRDPCPRLQEFC